jgi:hypothetical protein
LTCFRWAVQDMAKLQGFDQGMDELSAAHAPVRRRQLVAMLPELVAARSVLLPEPVEFEFSRAARSGGQNHSKSLLACLAGTVLGAGARYW